jgi:hypothetical protein
LKGKLNEENEIEKDEKVKGRTKMRNHWIYALNNIFLASKRILQKKENSGGKSRRYNFMVNS